MAEAVSGTMGELDRDAAYRLISRVGFLREDLATIDAIANRIIRGGHPEDLALVNVESFREGLDSIEDRLISLTDDVSGLEALLIRPRHAPGNDGPHPSLAESL